ncbi:MAG TPA: hypothetical protein VNQ79_15890 [Blastocatellia bacterium]|nr:hypothetical protein [Blastocatellia bacterium]
MNPAFDVSKITKGPAKAFAGVTVDVNGRVTMDTDGTPLASANPNAVGLGLFTTDGKAFSDKPKGFTDSEADELASPYRRIAQGSNITLKGTLLQLENLPVIAALTPGAVYESSSGLEEISSGGALTVSHHTVLLVWPSSEHPNHYVHLLLYRAFNSAGLEFTIKRTEDAKMPVEWTGEPDTSRPDGKNVWKLWRTVPAGQESPAVNFQIT